MTTHLNFMSFVECILSITWRFVLFVHWPLYTVLGNLWPSYITISVRVWSFVYWWIQT